MFWTRIHTYFPLRQTPPSVAAPARNKPRYLPRRCRHRKWRISLRSEAKYFRSRKKDWKNILWSIKNKITCQELKKSTKPCRVFPSWLSRISALGWYLAVSFPWLEPTKLFCKIKFVGINNHSNNNSFQRDIMIEIY